MEPKKSKKADLQNKRVVFMQLGFVVALAMVLIAFEWTSKPGKITGFASDEADEIVQENVPITRQEEKKPPPPPPPPKTTEVLNIVDNDIDIEDELILEETEADQDTRVLVDVFRQEEEEEEEEDKVFITVEDMPTFMGKGLNEFRNYIQKNLDYPLIAKENGIEGIVYTKFIVDKDGSVKNVGILRGVDPVLDQATVEAIRESPKWEPGKQRGIPVRVSVTMPIAFVLD
ncbi:MAG: energy transducer TonB [Bacteroidales bacterium]|nr:energy transducer TonB [Bacteroidales bacterium]MBS3775845.1 energy transducer TonB [Bacteroidales bacterium]